MNKSISVAVLLFFLSVSTCLAAVCDDWDSLDKQVRDSRVDKTVAMRKIIELHRSLMETYGNIVHSSQRYFPVQGYGMARSSGGMRGSDFKPRGYSFYDGNRHGGHPAHDLFVRDRNQDCIDDLTGRPVEILSYDDGVVIATNPEWEYPSKIRGGKYVWIFSPSQERYYYYAHLSEIMVVPGDIVKAGTPIGFLGRTGKNAFARRSPTHLHFMCLSFSGGDMRPIKMFGELSRAVTVPAYRAETTF